MRRRAGGCTAGGERSESIGTAQRE
jgi:hypothetical protein